VIPYVLTWDGKYHDTYATFLGVERNIRTYYIVMKRTLESLSIDFRRRKCLEEPPRREMIGGGYERNPRRSGNGRKGLVEVEG